GGTTLTTSSSIDNDVLLAKFSGIDGSSLWAKSFPGPGLEQPNGIATDGNGNVAITGCFAYTVNLGGGVLSATPAGNDDVFVAKYSGSGAHLWSERFGG